MYDGYAALAPRRAAEADTPVGPDSLVALIRRVEDAIEAETAAIRSEPRFDIAASNARKGRHLYDLTRAMKGQTPQSLPQTVQDALAQLRTRLDENSQVIAAHLAAVSEIAALMKGAIQRSENDGTYSESHFRAEHLTVLKFAVAAIWICAVTVGSIIFAFSAAAPKTEEESPAYFGGLDYVKTEMLSIPVIKGGAVQGYFLARLVYTIEKEQEAKLSVPPQALIVDGLYSYIYGNPLLDFTAVETLDLATLKAGIRDSINAKIGQPFIHEVLVEQVDFLSKADIRDNNIRRKTTAGDEAAGEPAQTEAPAPAH